MDLRFIYRSLGPIDLRSLSRDSLLSWMVFMPLLLALVLRFGVPLLAGRVLEVTGFDVSPYIPVLLAVYIVLMTPMLFGMLVGFLLLDEKDDDTLTALQVSPLSLNEYLAYRIGMPTALAFFMTLVLFPLTGLAQMPLGDLILISAAAAPLAPLMGLTLPSFAANKVQGFALLKALGGVMVLPVLSYFVSDAWELLFGILPTYWPIKVYWLVEAGAGNIWPYALVGFAYQVALVGALTRRLGRVLHR